MTDMPHRDELFKRVRDAARRLKTFTKSDLYREAPGHSADLRIGLMMLIAEGIVRKEGRGRSRMASAPQGRRADLYVYVDPKERPGHVPDPKSRPRRESPDREARRHAPIVRPPGRPEIAQKSPRTQDKDLNDLLDQVEEQGAELARTGKGHVRVRFAGQHAVVPNTPSDHRSYKNVRSELRRMGFDV